ncbi:aldehyde oxidase 1-like isoform X2 [Stegostoma tigrinum]|uniref:aldehyde oxidase 1-like isoform X2 n=1 Tax=Stegostoma tigrinum TaxID=3053191 RepID=UPI00202B7E6E|nr:aldehyde oxidase 1-like isoform X2 [Stegostoma tigrinum]
MSQQGITDELVFFVNGRKVREQNADPELMLLPYLRKTRILLLFKLTGTKYGCGGGGCGSCTVMISKYNAQEKKILHFSVNACLTPLCMLHGAAVTTVEGIGSTRTSIHPVQEYIAKAHGSQCGFCTPGMVMSMYTLLRNNPTPSMAQLQQCLAGNLCRCTGYRPIVDAFRAICTASNCCQRTGPEESCHLGKAEQDGILAESRDSDQLQVCSQLFKTDDLLPLDETQELIFPPELMLMEERREKRTFVFRGERMMWIVPANLEELLQLKSQYPKAPLVVGNTNIGPNMKFKGAVHPVIIHPAKVSELHSIQFTEEGLRLGAACSLGHVKDVLEKATAEFATEKTETFQALVEQLRVLGGEQIRNLASLGGNIVSGSPTSDLNPILAASKCVLELASKGGRREIHLDENFFAGFGKTSLRPEELLLSVFIPFSRKWQIVFAFRQASRRENAFSIVNAGMQVVFKDETNVVANLRMFFGGVGPTTVYAKRCSKELTNRSWDENLLNQACEMLLDDISLPDSAPGGSVKFRRTLTISFFYKFYLQVWQRLQQLLGKEDPFGVNIPERFRSATIPFSIKLPQGFQRLQKAVLDQFSWDAVGQPVMHLSAIKHATGEAVYCDDIPSQEGELFLALVTSTRAHAKIVSIDASEALHLPGVFDIITTQDIPGKKIDMEEILCGSEVTCVGHIICGIVADSQLHAKIAAAAVKIMYEDLEPLVLTLEDAIQHKSFYDHFKLENGDVDAAFEKADQQLEGQIHIGGQEHFYMETHGVLVTPKGEDGETEIVCSTQYPKFAQTLVADTLGIPSNRVTIRVKRIGGAFGGKVVIASRIAAIAAVAAHKTGRSVRCILERGEDMLISGGRHPVLGRYKVGYLTDGRIIAAEVTCYSNGGNEVDCSLVVMQEIVSKLDSGYYIPHVRLTGFVCKTNLPSNTAFRGFGQPQAIAITESWITDVATKCGLSAEKVREINLYRGQEACTPYKHVFDSRNQLTCWNECLQMASYHNRKISVEKFNNLNRWKKRGISIVPLRKGVGFSESTLNQAGALLHVYEDGSVLLTHGGTEMGQGLHTKILQIASHELKIPMSAIHLSETSTGMVPNTSPTAASSGTDLNGMAVKDACQTLLQRLQPFMQENPKGTWKDWVEEAFKNKVSLSTTGFFKGDDTVMDWEKGEGTTASYFVFGAACSEVEIDCLTGDHKNIRTDIVIDAGCSINPAVDIGQIEGAFTQGLGLFTMEELKYSPKGVLYTRGPTQYEIPAVCDIPEQLNVSLLPRSQNPKAIYSSKGIGEAAVLAGCSVFYAIKDAIAAARREIGLTGSFTLNSPSTPARIRMACIDQFTEMVPDCVPESIPWAIVV